MAKISANYEVVYIIDPAQGEEAIAATVYQVRRRSRPSRPRAAS